MSQPDRDPRMRVIDIAYMTLIPIDGIKPQAGDDASEALWFDITFNDEIVTFANKEKNITIKYSLKEEIFKNGCIKHCFSSIQIFVGNLNGGGGERQ